MPSLPGLEWTFNTDAALYEKMRPGYPEALYRDIFAACPIGRGSGAVEIGIGGGQATLPILQTGCSVLAVEYGEKLAALCRGKFADHPEFSCVTARFEECSLPEKSYDLIYSASAFHWIPEEVGYRKVFASLKSGGVFARFANHPFHDKGRPGLPEAIEEQYKVYMPGSKEPVEYTEKQAADRAAIALKYGFVDIRHYLYHRQRSFTAEQYIKLLGTYSDHIALPEPVRKEFFEKIRRTIDDFGGEITLYDTLDLQLARKP